MEVTVKQEHHLVKIFYNDDLVATHIRSKAQGTFTTNVSHYALEKRHCPGFAEYDSNQEEQMKSIDNHCTAMLAYMKSNNKYDWYKGVSGIIGLRKFYSDELIDQACHRALHYGICSYSKIKRILENGSYILPLSDRTGGDYANIN